MKKELKRFWEASKRFWDDCAQDAHYGECSMFSTVGWAIGNWFVMRVYGRLMCWKFGHGKHWVDESYAGPESGGDGGHCDRCGDSFSVKYY